MKEGREAKGRIGNGWRSQDSKELVEGAKGEMGPKGGVRKVRYKVKEGREPKGGRSKESKA